MPQPPSGASILSHPYPTLRYTTLAPQLYFPRGTCKRSVGVSLSRRHAINSCDNSTSASRMTRPAPITPKKGSIRSTGESSYGRKGVSVGVSPLPHPGLGLPGHQSEGGELCSRAVHARARRSRKGRPPLMVVVDVSCALRKVVAFLAFLAECVVPD